MRQVCGGTDGEFAGVGLHGVGDECVSAVYEESGSAWSLLIDMLAEWSQTAKLGHI